MGNSSSTSTPNIQDPPPSVKTQENERESASFFDDTPVKGKGTQASPSRKTTLLSSWFFGSDHSGGYLKILFCGLDTFPAAYIYTALELKYNRKIIVRQCREHEIEEEITDTHVLVPLMCKIDRGLLEKAPYLNLIQQFGVAVDGVDVETASELGICVANIPSDSVGNAQACAEHAIFLCLAVLRNLPSLNECTRKGYLGTPIGKTIMDSSIMIYGFGNIGKQLAQRLFAFSPKRIVAIKRLPWIGAVPMRIEEIGLEKDVPRLSKGIDIVFVCCGQGTENVGIINKSFISNLNKGAVIVNITRGELLNYQDIYQALQSEHLSGVGIDVYREEPFPLNDPFLRHPRVVVTPHIAGVTEVSFRSMAKTVAGNVERLMKDEELQHVLNY